MHISVLYVFRILLRLKQSVFVYRRFTYTDDVALNGVVMEFIVTLMLSSYRSYRRLFALIIGWLSFFRRVRSRPLGQAKPLYKNNSHPMCLILSDNRRRALLSLLICFLGFSSASLFPLSTSHFHECATCILVGCRLLTKIRISLKI